MHLKKYYHTALLGFLYVQAPSVKHTGLDGTNNITLATGVSPYTVDFDYRYIISKTTGTVSFCLLPLTNSDAA